MSLIVLGLVKGLIVWVIVLRGLYEGWGRETILCCVEIAGFVLVRIMQVSMRVYELFCVVKIGIILAVILQVIDVAFLCEFRPPQL